MGLSRQRQTHSTGIGATSATLTSVTWQEPGNRAPMDRLPDDLVGGIVHGLSRQDTVSLHVAAAGKLAAASAATAEGFRQWLAGRVARRCKARILVGGATAAVAPCVQCGKARAHFVVLDATDGGGLARVEEMPGGYCWGHRPQDWSRPRAPAYAATAPIMT